MHDNWEYSEAVKHAYKNGAKLRLSILWNALQEKIFALIDENVVPDERGPDMLAKLFPFGQSSKTAKKKHAVKTVILNSTYLGGHTSIFERAMGLVPAAAKALIKGTRGLGSEEIQKAAKRLNHIGSSLVLETVDERELLILLK